MVLQLLSNPDSFFAARAENPSLLAPAGVVLVVALLGALGSVPVFSATVDALPPEAGPFVTVIRVVGAAFGVVFTFAAWFLYALAFHLVASIAFDGDGSLRDTFALTGWGFVPAVFGAAVNAAASYLVFTGVRLPDDPARIAAFVRELQSRPELLAAGVVGIAFLLWSAFLWTFAVSHVQGLDLRSAALTVAGPVVVALLFRLNGLVGVL